MMNIRKLIAGTCCAAMPAIPATFAAEIIHDAEKWNIRLQITPVIKGPFMDFQSGRLCE